MNRLLSPAIARFASATQVGRHRILWVTLGGVYLVATLVLVAYTARHLVPYGDWNIWALLPSRLAELRLYDHSDPTYTWVWSPLAAWLMAVVVLPLGPLVWAGMHFAVLLMLREIRLILIVATSYPFWMDTLMGNTFTFCAVTGYLAWKGNRWAALAYLALVVLMPRPVQLPLMALLLWRVSSLRLPFAAMLAIGAITSIGSGYATEWARVLIGVGLQYPSQEFNFSPTRLVGAAWLIIGIPLAVWLTARRHPGWAGIAMTPYLVPQYFLMLLIEAPDLARRAMSVRAVRQRLTARAGSHGEHRRGGSAESERTGATGLLAHEIEPPQSAARSVALAGAPERVAAMPHARATNVK